jgi:hypothetical protein
MLVKENKMEERKKVYEAIDKEREYQNKKWTENHDPSHSLSDWILFIEQHLNKAKEKVYYQNATQAKKEIRKITALGVACMEYQGIIHREE